MWGNHIPYKTVIVRTEYDDVCEFWGITSDTQCLINDTFHCFFASLPSLHPLAISYVSYSHLYSDSHTWSFLTLCCCLWCFLHKECPDLHFCLFHCILSIVMTPPQILFTAEDGQSNPTLGIPCLLQGLIEGTLYGQQDVKEICWQRLYPSSEGDHSSSSLEHGCVWMCCLNYCHPIRDEGCKIAEEIERNWPISWSYSWWAQSPLYLGLLLSETKIFLYWNQSELELCLAIQKIKTFLVTMRGDGC